MVTLNISFQSLWRIIKIVSLIQLINAVMDYLMWFIYGYLVPSWTIATLLVSYTIMILAIKIAQEREAKPALKDQR